MMIKKSGGKIYGAVLSASERKAMEMEITRQIKEADTRYKNDIDSAILYTLHSELGFGAERLRRFWDAFEKVHNDLLRHYEMQDEDYTWLCTRKLKDIGVDVEAWNKERMN